MKRLLENFLGLSAVIDKTRFESGSSLTTKQNVKNGLSKIREGPDQVIKNNHMELHESDQINGEKAGKLSYTSSQSHVPEVESPFRISQNSTISSDQVINGVERRVQEFRFAYEEAAQKEKLMKRSGGIQDHQKQGERCKKISIHIKLDEDVIAHFKKDGRGYQTRINSFLRKALL